MSAARPWRRSASSASSHGRYASVPATRSEQRPCADAEADGARLVGQRVDQRCLADAGLAGHGQQAATPLAGRLERPGHGLAFARPADEHRRGRGSPRARLSSAGAVGVSECGTRSRSANAATTAAAGGRCRESFASRPSTRWSKAAGKPGLTLDGGAGSAWTSATTVAGSVAAWNGWHPVASSYMTRPSENRSVAGPTQLAARLLGRHVAQRAQHGARRGRRIRWRRRTGRRRAAPIRSRAASRSRRCAPSRSRA